MDVMTKIFFCNFGHLNISLILNVTTQHPQGMSSYLTVVRQQV